MNFKSKTIKNLPGTTCLAYYNDKIMIIYIVGQTSALEANKDYVINELPSGYIESYSNISGNHNSTRPFAYVPDGTLTIYPSNATISPSFTGMLVTIKP